MVRIKNIKIILAVFILSLFFTPANFSVAKETDLEYPGLCAVYLTGIGCGNCALTDPIILSDLLAQYKDFVVIEYEIYKLREANQKVSTKYFENYLSGTRPGVPFFILNKNLKALGGNQVVKAQELLDEKETNSCPLPSGESKDFKNLDLNYLPGKAKIWHKDRVLIKEDKNAKGNNLKELLTTPDINLVLEKIKYQKIEPKKVLISKGEISFKNAIQANGWLFQWGRSKISKDKPTAKQPIKSTEPEVTPDTQKVLIGHIFFLKEKIKTKNLYILIEALIILLLVLLLLRKKLKIAIIILLSLAAIAAIFILAKNIPPNLLRSFSTKVPFPVFTFLIAIVDGFNPCNLFVLTLLLALLISASGSKKRVYLVGFTFVFIVFMFYFLFMAAWLNIFKYFNYFASLRMIIGSIAILAGLINCKDYFFFKKGISLTIGDKQRGVLVKKMDRVRKTIAGGSLFMLIVSSMGLAIFSSFVELPCTAGFPIIFTTVLANKTAAATGSYYLWILLYNLVYILPLALIVAIFGYTFKAQRIGQKQIKIIKLIGGIIMIVLGLILLINPQLVGVALQ